MYSFIKICVIDNSLFFPRDICILKDFYVIGRNITLMVLVLVGDILGIEGLRWN